VEIKTLSLQFLRSRISIIPQDPVLFSGTIRENVDPVGMYKDEDIWRVLEEAGLKKVILSLDYGVVGGGSNFSVGEKQLICLARAIIQKNQIVVLDEATANIDPQTEELIYQTIREKFASCTVFTIAHKLKSVLDNDKILVLDKGEVIEFDEPSNLLADESTTFHKMAEEMGLLSR
jgi:ATP-binding cassette subfamily C (CFTR/MRP) protein 4